MRTLTALIACSLVLAACGGDDEEPPSSSTPAPAAAGGGETLQITAKEPFAFDPAELTAKAGEVTLSLELPDDLQAPHAIAIEGKGSGDTVEAGATSTLTEELEPGEYVYFCPVGSHRADGMEGTLTVG